MIRTKGEPGTGDVVQAVRHMRMMQSEIHRIASMGLDELFRSGKELAGSLWFGSLCSRKCKASGC